jgi:hypothetical protein
MLWADVSGLNGRGLASFHKLLSFRFFWFEFMVCTGTTCRRISVFLHSLQYSGPPCSGQRGTYELYLSEITLPRAESLFFVHSGRSTRPVRQDKASRPRCLRRIGTAFLITSST